MRVLWRALIVSTIALCAARAEARPHVQRHELTVPTTHLDVVGDAAARTHGPQKTLQDTVWIANWTFDVGGACDDSGWEHVDNYILNDGTLYWEIGAALDGVGGISGNAALLGYNGDACCVDPDGYGNNWHQAIRIEYSGGATLSFDYLVDSEAAFDFLQVEVDSACASFERVDVDSNPAIVAADFRPLLFSADGLDLAGSVVDLPLTNYGAGTHCVYIAFFSDIGFSPCDGFQPTQIGEAIVVDNIVLVDGDGTRSEDFSDGTLDIGTFVNLRDLEPFGTWARTYEHITDNDVCTENTSCAWLWTDHTTPTIANDPSMAFAPGSFVVRNWLDDSIVSPWVDLSSTPDARGTILQFRRFPGNFFTTSRIVQNWSVRGKEDVDDGMGGTVECVRGWGHAFQWSALATFAWITPTASGNAPASGYDMTPNFSSDAVKIQVRHRTSDWQRLAGASAPPIFAPGPGPFVDRTRIGRIVLTGPVFNEGIDARSQAQDAFPTEIHTGITPGTGEHFRPTTDRFGSTAFSRSGEIAAVNGESPNLVTGDSIRVEVIDARDAGGVTSVDWYGAIISGPHAGKAPPPWSVGSNGFFVVPAQPALFPDGTPFENRWFVDLDDDYFRGGDMLYYFWLSADALGGINSLPVGLSGVPGSIADAELATSGLFEVSFLPTIDWDPGYLGRIAADPHGDVEPTQEEIANSSQKNCILYVNITNNRRRTGDVNRTSFMYTLDRLGYRSHYDIYDHMGMGNTNNHLGGRATIEQAQGYSLIVYDAGNAGPGGTIVPDGSDLDAQKVDQAGWFRDWLAQGGVSEAGNATLWLIGSNVLEAKSTNPLYTNDFGVTLNAPDQGLNANPDVEGQGSFTFAVNGGTANVDFSTGPRSSYSLNGGCPIIRNYDALGALSSAVEVYRYQDPGSGVSGDAAIVMNSNLSFNTILQSHPWFDIRDPSGSPPGSPSPEEDLLARVLGAVIPLGCQQAIDPTDAPGPSDIIAAPAKTVLHQNSPNPFNPTTTIRFDLARDAHVSLKIYDVAGRLVRRLVDEKRVAGWNHTATWNGMDDAGERVSSGVYVYRIEAGSFAATRKMVLLK